MRYKCTVTYDGTLFHGFQTQKNERTVQEEIEKVLLIINKKKTIVYSSGRTDAGVHAIGQVFHFDSELNMPEENMLNAINSRLPRDVYITNVEIVDDNFYARFSVKEKEYHYLINMGEYDPLKRNYYFFYKNSKFNYDIFCKAKDIFIGEHDFRSFTKNHKLENTIRTIYKLDVIKEEDIIKVIFVGNGFMHNMVRIITAMMLEAAIGKITLDDLENILKQKNRKLAPKILPASGLYLYKVYY